MCFCHTTAPLLAIGLTFSLCAQNAAILTINVESVIDFSVFEPRPQHLRKVPDFATRMPDYFL